MLGKLLKYEIKATARLFIPLYLTILVFSVINRFLFPIYGVSNSSSALYSIIAAISMFAYGTLMAGLVVMTLFVLIQRFYKNLLGDEGYLMFTLPVQSQRHIFSKLTISMLWTIASAVVGFCSIVIISSKTVSTVEFFSHISAAFSQFTQYFGASAYLISLEAIGLVLLSLASSILAIYAAIALGHLFNKHKLLIAFGMYIILRTVSQIIMSVFGVILFSQDIFKPGGTFIPSPTLVSGMLLAAILYYGVFSAGYFVLTNYILKKKLNLE